MVNALESSDWLMDAARLCSSLQEGSATDGQQRLQCGSDADLQQHSLAQAEIHICHPQLNLPCMASDVQCRVVTFTMVQMLKVFTTATSR